MEDLDEPFSNKKSGKGFNKKSKGVKEAEEESI
jgi:hypothetical protein